MQQTIGTDRPGTVTLRDRVMGCWLGKAVGGTLGMPFEGMEGPLDVHFYDPVPTEMLPNDDLDLQVVWACVLDHLEQVVVDRHILANAWLDHVQFPWDEYGVALRNLKNGLKPPLSGSFDNWFINGMGAPIRSEIWACLAPGNPSLAAAYAIEDACVDHADEGIWGEAFLAGLQSAAFVESDIQNLLQVALSLIPETSLTSKAINSTIRWWKASEDWKIVRTRILAEFGHENFTDVPMNLAFIILAWLASEGDFSRAICIAVNCGKDTDCTAATLGALMGIIDPNAIPQRWLEPIGRSLVLNDGIVGISAPTNLDDFTDLIIRLKKRLDSRLPAPQTFDQDLSHLSISAQIAFAESLSCSESAPPLDHAKSVTLPGTVGHFPIGAFEENVLLVKYNFQLPGDGQTRILFNTPTASSIWVDGSFAFARPEGGVMAPLHRAPQGQWVDLQLRAGCHEVIAALQRSDKGHDAQWVIAIGDAITHQWIAPAFN